MKASDHPRQNKQAIPKVALRKKGLGSDAEHPEKIAARSGTEALRMNPEYRAHCSFLQSPLVADEPRLSGTLLFFAVFRMSRTTHVH